MLTEMVRTAGSLAHSGKAGQTLRDNEWLASLRGRVTMPGGASQVDMPSYHAWQHKPQEQRQTDLAQWSQPLRPLFEGVKIAMRVLRESGERHDMVASQGAYQQMMAGKVYQLLRVWVDPSVDAFPEMSGNKHMIWIRFSKQDAQSKPQQTTLDMPFVMSLCNG